MRVLITSGGTSEAIDDVRSITNHSTGKLGAAIAHSFFNEGHTIDYITTKNAVAVREKTKWNIHYVTSTQDVEDKLTELLHSHHYDAVIHAMAISDYKPKATTSLEKVAEVLSTELKDTSYDEIFRVLQDIHFEEQEKKISSAPENLVTFLEKTPKVIHLVKKIQPDTLLVGFKLLVDVEKDELIDVAFQNIIKNKADFVLANDLDNIDETKHIGYLVDVSKHVETFTTKQEIAKGIVHAVEERRKILG